MSAVRHNLAGLLLAAALPLAPAPARAGWGVTEIRDDACDDVAVHLAAGDQVYPLTLAGLSEMCLLQPTLCPMRWQRDRLAALRAKRALGWGLVGGGWGLLLAGALLAEPGSKAMCGDAASCASQRALVGIGAASAILMNVVGLAIIPGRGDLLAFVKKVLHATPTTTLQLHLGLRAGGAPRLVLSRSF